MAVRRSSVITLTIQPAAAFSFGNWSNMTAIIGGDASQSRGYTQGLPVTPDSALDAVAITFYTDATMSTTRAGTETVGDAGMTRTLAQVVTVSHQAATDMFTVTVDAGNGLGSTTDIEIFFDLSIVQPDP